MEESDLDALLGHSITTRACGITRARLGTTHTSRNFELFKPQQAATPLGGHGFTGWGCELTYPLPLAFHSVYFQP